MLVWRVYTGALLLDLCATHSLSITNTVFDVTGHWSMSMIDFVVVSADLLPYVLGTQVKRGVN